MKSIRKGCQLIGEVTCVCKGVTVVKTWDSHQGSVKVIKQVSVVAQDLGGVTVASMLNSHLKMMIVIWKV